MDTQNYKGFAYMEATLDDMLNEREWRANKSSQLIKEKGETVVCMTMNLIGEYKLLPASSAVFNVFYKLVKNALKCEYDEKYHKSTGDVAFFITKLDATQAKNIAERIEDFSNIGRLFDIDVFGVNGEKLTRTKKRKCLICDCPAAECSRNRTHGVGDVREKTQQIILQYFSELINEYAHSALIDELDTTPKPGLVDRANSGANNDMDYHTFVKSAEAIAPYFGQLFCEGAMTDSLKNKDFIANIQKIGIEAEIKMRSVTNGVNTHKGAIYSLGLISVGLGYAIAGGGKLEDAIFAAADVALTLSDNIIDVNTNGIKVCQKYKVTGARGEAIGGFKTVLFAFNRIKHYVDDKGLDVNTAYPLVICDIMSVMTDTNVLHRGGMDALQYMHKEAGEISQMRENQRIDDLKELDEEFIKRNISPGGCADALACALFLINSEKLFF